MGKTTTDKLIRDFKVKQEVKTPIANIKEEGIFIPDYSRVSQH